MPPTTPDRSKLSELTVTCHQCGSASMERLDAKEYRCNHCGAITVISDDDSERLEKMLTNALNRPAPAAPAASGSGTGLANPRVSMILGIVLMAVVAILFLVFTLIGGRSSSPSYTADNSSHTVPLDQVTLSQLHVEDPSAEPAYYAGMIYNHSGYAIDVPSYTMTFFPNGMKGDSTRSDTDLDRLLPGEYEPIRFMTWKSQLGSRYEIDRPDSIHRNHDDIASPKLTQQQLVHHVGHGYELVGVLQNTYTRPIEHVRVMAILYGPNNEQLAANVSMLNDLRPGEKDAVQIDLQAKGKDGDNLTVTAYEYLVDASFADRTR
jgi:hypothetical protein